MEALTASSVSSLNYIPKALHKSTFSKPKFINLDSSVIPSWPFSSTYHKNTSRSLKVFTISSQPPPSSTISRENTPPTPEPELETGTKDENFDWFSHWYPIMPVRDLDKRVPHGRKVIGLDIVVWWDKNENTWRVFDDACPHRLAPLSDGRIDQWGRLQCAYHGWCFNGSGNCKLIPQASPDGPPVHTFKKACVGVYPTTVQHDMVWFWPSTDPKYKDIIKKKTPPFIPELDDPSSTKVFMHRDFPYGYEVLVANLMDPAHVPYAHYGIMLIDQPPIVKVDREGGKPLELGVKKLDINGLVGRQEWGSVKFVAPCTYCMYADPVDVQGNESDSSTGTDKTTCGQNLPAQRSTVSFFYCVPVSPGNSRLIWGITKSVGSWIENIIPQWLFHLKLNLLVDSDLYLLHIEERKIIELGGANNWQKACFVPTRSDALVVGFRRWLNKYAGCQVNWGGKFCGTDLPPTPPREQLMDRYRSHVVSCRSCSSAYKALTALEVMLQIVSVVSTGIVAATRHNVIPTTVRTTVVSVAIVCFAASRWLAHFIYKSFHFHDYNHSLQ